MQGAPSDFWGKLQTDAEGRVQAWHPLISHCAEVAACFEMLLHQPCLVARVTALGSTPVDETLIQRLSVFAALHDLGKFNGGFQAKALPHPTRVAGHVREALQLFDSPPDQVRARVASALSLVTLCDWFDDDEGSIGLLLATLAHHGRPMEPSAFFSDALWRGTQDRDPFEGIARLGASLQAWFPLAYEPGGTLIPSSAPLQHLVNGLVTLADWLASDERYFPFDEEPSEAGLPLIHAARIKAAQLAGYLGICPDPYRHALNVVPLDFGSVTGVQPRGVQSSMCDLPQVSSGRSLTIIEAPTGSGKTEAALFHFIRLFRSGAVDGLYFALPTRTAATQIHGRIVAAVRRLFPTDETRPPVTLAVPGYLRVDDVEGRRLSRFEVLWNDDARERFAYRGWAAENPKRYLAGSIVVGTVDQVLLSHLQVPHAHLRGAALLRHLLVVDEVHASDAYMGRLLEEVLRWHGSAGGHALLMTATLGINLRQRLEAAFLGTGHPGDSDKGEGCPFPVVWHHSNTGSAHLTPSCEEDARAVRIELLPVGDDPRSIAAPALAAAQRGARVLVVRNLVRDCVATQLAVESLSREAGSDALLFSCNGRPAPHHSRFARADRIALDLALEAAFGRHRDSGGMVVVATQTVQQSLDIDADFLITDLCPMDVLLQRLGRLHRHARGGRPDGFQTPRALIAVPEERDLSGIIDSGGKARGRRGIGTVYEDLRGLEATWRQLEARQQLAIPRDARDLVEPCVDPANLEALATALGGPWLKHSTHLAGQLCAERRVGEVGLVDWSVPFCSPDVLFSTANKSIGTRLGANDRLAAFPEPVQSPLGQPVDGLALSEYLTRELPAEAAVSSIRVSESQISFRFGERPFVYDRLGVRRDENGDPDPLD